MQRIPICFVLLCLIALVGCNNEKKNETAESSVTYHNDIEPMMASHCTRCHYDGGLGSGDFTDADEVESLAEWMQTAMDDDRMPPPASDPDCRDYTGSDHLRMSDESKDLFAAWMDGGMERGESDESAVSETLNTELAQPDVTILMPDVYTPTYERTDEPDNEYRCFILDTSELEGKYITAIGAQVGTPEIMHHITLSLVDKDDVTEEYEDPQGWDCIDNVVTFPSEFMFAGFAPGTMPFEFPEGVWFRDARRPDHGAFDALRSQPGC